MSVAIWEQVLICLEKLEPRPDELIAAVEQRRDEAIERAMSLPRSA